MTDEHLFRGLLHRAMHSLPGVPRHAEQPAGHQGAIHQGRARRGSRDHQGSQNHGCNHSTARPPRMLAAWQLRIAAFFGR